MLERIGLPADHPPRVHPRRHRRRHRLQPRGVRGHRRARPRRLHDRPDPHRPVGHRLEGIRTGGHARPRRQRRHHLLDRKHRRHGRPHRRLDHRRPRPDADRQGIPAHARCAPWPSSAPSASRPAARISSSPSTPTDRRDGRHRDEPARLAAPRRWRPRPRASPSPRSPPSWPWATRLESCPTTSPARPSPASSRPSTTASPRFRAGPSRSSPKPTRRSPRR